MNCHIIKDKEGNEYLIPYCNGVGMSLHLDMPDREIIKEFCYCDRSRKEKYETKTRDEVFIVLAKLKSKILKQEQELEKMKEELSMMEYEVLMLSSTVINFEIEKL